MLRHYINCMMLLVLVGCSTTQNISKHQEKNTNYTIRSIKEFFCDTEDHTFSKYEDSQQTLKSQSIFGKNGKILEVAEFYTDGQLDNRKKYTYDQQGRVIQEKIYDSDDSLKNIFTFKYNEQGHEVEKKWLYSDGSVMGEWTHTYDEYGNLIEEYSYTFDEDLDTTYTYEYKYDKYNNWIRKITYEDGKIINIEKREIEYYE